MARSGGVGTLLATGADHRIVRIISERNVVRVLDEKGPLPLSAPVAEVMTRRVVTRDRSETIMERITGACSNDRSGRLAGIICRSATWSTRE